MPLFGGRPSTADRRGLGRRGFLSRRRRSWWCRAGRVVLLGAASCPGRLIFPLTCTLTLESAAELPLAFAIKHPANRLTASGTAVACLVASQLRRCFMASWPIAQDSRRKNLCCVTTRRRNFRRLRCLRRSRGTLTARPLGLGVLGLDRFILPPPGLPPGRLPAPYQAQALGILAVVLVPTFRLILASTAFAQADPRPRSSRPGTAAAISLIITLAHGRYAPRGQPGENALTFSSGAYPTVKRRPSANLEAHA